MQSDTVLKVQRLKKVYNHQVVISGLSFNMHRGQRMALFAPSGAGKTTLIRILANLESPTGGSFEIGGPQPTVIFQQPRLFPYMTLHENLLLPLQASRQPITPDTQRSYDQWLEVCELTASRELYPWQLSGGMKQKAALIRALLPHPAFVLMDEPFESIGLQSKQRIIRHILETNPQMTLLLVTHNIEEAAQLTDSVLYFQGSQLSEPLEISSHAFRSHFSFMMSQALPECH